LKDIHIDIHRNHENDFYRNTKTKAAVAEFITSRIQEFCNIESVLVSNTIEFWNKTPDFCSINRPDICSHKNQNSA
jgi:hypothetical protein